MEKFYGGIELNVSILGNNAEILVYNFDIEEMKELTKEFYPSREELNKSINKNDIPF